ncbi:hypothetical protein HRbin11_01344 [bacterium HR11]|nr:hypothetical protein HRbin11_01344 [bacterium HR11]
MRCGGNLRHSDGGWRMANEAGCRGQFPRSSPFAYPGRGRRDGTWGLGWLRGLLAVALLVASWSCKQTKEITIPDPDSNATALYILKILNIQPDDIDMNTEGTASATVFARLTDARGNPLAGQVLFFEVGDVPNVTFNALIRVEQTTEQRNELFACGYPDCPPPRVLVTVSVNSSVSQNTSSQSCTVTLPGSFFGDLSFRYRTTDSDGRAQTQFTSVRVKKFFDLALGACLATFPTESVQTQTSDTTVTDPVFCGVFGVPCIQRTVTTTRTTTAVIDTISITPLQFSFELPIRVRWNDPQYNLQVFDVRPLEVHIPQFWHD